MKVTRWEHINLTGIYDWMREPQPKCTLGLSRLLGDHAALAKVGSSLAIRSNRCPNPAPSVPL